MTGPATSPRQGGDADRPPTLNRLQNSAGGPDIRGAAGKGFPDSGPAVPGSPAWEESKPRLRVSAEYDDSVAGGAAEMASVRAMVNDPTRHPQDRFGAWRHLARLRRWHSDRELQIHGPVLDCDDNGRALSVCLCSLVIPWPTPDRYPTLDRFLLTPGHLRLPRMDQVAAAYVGNGPRGSYRPCCHACGLLPVTADLEHALAVADAHEQGLHGRSTADVPCELSASSPERLSNQNGAT